MSSNRDHVIMEDLAVLRIIEQFLQRKWIVVFVDDPGKVPRLFEHFRRFTAELQVRAIGSRRCRFEATDERGGRIEIMAFTDRHGLRGVTADAVHIVDPDRMLAADTYESIVTRIAVGGELAVYPPRLGPPRGYDATHLIFDEGVR